MIRRQYSGDSSRKGVIAVQPTVETTRSTAPSAATASSSSRSQAAGSVASQPSSPRVSDVLVCRREVLDRSGVEVGGDRADAAARRTARPRRGRCPSRRRPPARYRPGPLELQSCVVPVRGWCADAGPVRLQPIVTFDYCLDIQGFELVVRHASASTAGASPRLVPSSRITTCSISASAGPGLGRTRAVDAEAALVPGGSEASQQGELALLRVQGSVTRQPRRAARGTPWRRRAPSPAAGPGWRRTRPACSRGSRSSCVSPSSGSDVSAARRRGPGGCSRRRTRQPAAAIDASGALRRAADG